ncbi:hypothetical protein HK405_002817 [Cladochytrium tenue]|nr:hypothetical protein HK405_002817 [Cladochytrium tenue]
MDDKEAAAAGVDPVDVSVHQQHDHLAKHGITLEPYEQLQRGLQSRHIQFMALGGAIGTGLFVGTGSILHSLGPAPLWLGYLTLMGIVWVVMNVLGEMATYLPMKGITIPYFVDRFFDPSMAFAAGWNYWYAYAILIAAETTAGAVLFEYWTTSVDTAVWITIILFVILALNIFAVEIFGEAEFWFASIKLITIVLLVVTSIVIILGGAPNHDRIGFQYWENPGAFKEVMVEGSAGRFLAYWAAVIHAGFAFITSPELIALAAGETLAPRRNIPKAARRFTWRLAIFYGVSSLLVGAIVSSDNPRLLSAQSNANASPWVIGIQESGIGVLNHIINAAILTSAWSAGNAFLYSGSRILYTMALNGQAPKLLAHTTRRGVPWAAVLATWLPACLAYLNVSNNGAVVFNWFANVTTISGFIAWLIVLGTYVRFRAALQHHGLLDTLPFRTPGQPYASYVALVFIGLLTITNGFQTFYPWDYQNFLASYITFPFVILLYLGHKLWYRTPFMRKIEDIDVITGKKEMDELCAMDHVEPEPANWVIKAWNWLA